MLILLEFSTSVAADVWFRFPLNLNEVGNKSLFGAFFYLKIVKFAKFSGNINRKLG